MSRRLTFILTVGVVVIWAIWAAFLLVEVDQSVTDQASLTYETTGQFGDSFGVLASLMSALAIIGALYSIHIQSINHERQQFESNFYKLLDNFSRERERVIIWIMGEPLDKVLHKRATYHSLKSHLREQKHVFKGQACMAILLYRLRDSLGPNGYSDSKLVAQHYRKVMMHANMVKTLFRLLYHIMKMIDRSEVNDKYLYSRILRAHISQTEFCLLAYNCAIDEGMAKFKPLAEKYSLFHNMQHQNLDDCEQAEMRFFHRRIGENAFRFEKSESVKYV